MLYFIFFVIVVWKLVLILKSPDLYILLIYSLHILSSPFSIVLFPERLIYLDPIGGLIALARRKDSGVGVLLLPAPSLGN